MCVPVMCCRPQTWTLCLTHLFLLTEEQALRQQHTGQQLQLMLQHADLRFVGTHMLQLELSPWDTEWSLLLEELAELLHLLTKGVTLAADVYGFSLLKGSQNLTPACMITFSMLQVKTRYQMSQQITQQKGHRQQKN